jgi:hypothetical protein
MYVCGETHACGWRPRCQVVPDADGVEVKESEMNPAFIVNMLPKLDWAALRTTARSVRLCWCVGR